MPLSQLSAQPYQEAHQDTDFDAFLCFSQVLKACADPLRVQILNALNDDTFGVLELTQIFETKQSGMSHHLKVLNQAGLVEAQREGNAIFYRRPLNFNEAHDREAIEHILQLIDRFPLSDDILNKISEIHSQRAIQSQAFFTKNADRFQAHQELIADHAQYAPASFELLCQSFHEPSFHKHRSVPKRVMEIGPGEGLFLPLISPRFSEVIALDNSEDMLKKARIQAHKQGLNNIQFHLGDTFFYRQMTEQNKLPRVDAVVMNMVLHHIPTPAKVFQDIASFLHNQGVLIVCELSHHNQTWTKENCGDIWLGFETEELSKWAENAGFKTDKTAFIGLRNGFQIQLRKFVKSELSGK